MKNFQYQILRYQPDRISGEFLNVGLIVFDSKQHEISFYILEKASGLSKVFDEINVRYLSKLLKHIIAELKKIQIAMKSEFQFGVFKNIEEITRSVFPKDDSSLYFTETREVLDIDIVALTQHLSERMISIKYVEKEKEINTDKEVWTKLYKKHFDDLDISKHLSPVSLVTKYNQLQFEHTWRNGHLNFFEAVNFDLEKIDSINNKVYRWAGQIDEMATSDEYLHLYLLSNLPIDKNRNEFILQFLKSKSSERVKVEVVTPESVGKVTAFLKEKMEY